MYLTIMRHGEAGRAATDRQRELTEQGRRDVASACMALADAWRKRDCRAPDRLLYSAWLRTTQTADIVREHLAPAQIAAEPALKPGAGVGDAQRLLDGLPPGDHVMLVSHQPLVSNLVAALLGDERVPGLNPAGVVTLELPEVAPGCGRLLFWALPPAYDISL